MQTLVLEQNLLFSCIEVELNKVAFLIINAPYIRFSKETICTKETAE